MEKESEEKFSTNEVCQIVGVHPSTLNQLNYLGIIKPEFPGAHKREGNFYSISDMIKIAGIERFSDLGLPKRFIAQVMFGKVEDAFLTFEMTTREIKIHMDLESLEFIIRQRADRHIKGEDGSPLSIERITMRSHGSGEWGQGREDS